MEKAVRAYAEVLRLVRRLPPESRGYYAKYARENFVNYREVDSATLDDLFQRTYNHSLWVLTKDPQNKRLIRCDEKLKKVFAGKDQVGMLEIAGLISPHFLK